MGYVRDGVRDMKDQRGMSPDRGGGQNVIGAL